MTNPFYDVMPFAQLQALILFTQNIVTNMELDKKTRERQRFTLVEMQMALRLRIQYLESAEGLNDFLKWGTFVEMPVIVKPLDKYGKIVYQTEKSEGKVPVRINEQGDICWYHPSELKIYISARVFAAHFLS